MAEKDEAPSPPGGQNVTGDDNIVTGDITKSVVNISKSVTNVFPSGAERKPPREPDPLPTQGELPEPKAALPDWHLPIPRNAVFTGREADLQALADGLLYHPQAGVTAISAVKGEGGIGKSQLAVEFAYRYGRYFYGVHWIPAGENQDIGAGVAMCGAKMGLPYWPEKLPEQVDATLRAWAESPLRLVVLDNLEDPERLREWLPRLGMCRLLVTTRRGNWPADLGVRDYPLDTLSLSESRDLLRKLARRLNETPDAELDGLANQLGCLPLALDLAGRYLDEVKSVGVSDYIKEIQSEGGLRHESLVDWTKTTPTDHASSLAATFALSFDQLQAENKYDLLAKHLFYAAGYCAPNTPIPLWLLKLAVGDEKDSVFSRALRRLADLGLVRESENGPSLHPLMAEFARVVEPQESGALAGLAEALFGASYVAESTGSTKAWQPIRAHMEVAAVYKKCIGLELAGHLLFALGQCLYFYGEYTGARRYYEQSLATFQELGDRSGVAVSLHQLGMLHQDQGEYPQAHERYEQSLAIDQELGNRSAVAKSLHQMGILYYQQGEYSQARRYYEQSLATFQELNDRSGVARSHGQLGILHQDQGEYHQARQYYEQSLTIAQELGDQACVASSLHQLGMLHQQLGEYPKAREFTEQALAIKQELGDRSGVAKSLHQLGMLHQQQGKYPKAREFTEQSLAIKQELGDRSGMAKSLHQLGMLHQDQGEYQQARQSYEQAMVIFQELGNRSSVSSGLHQLGTLHHLQGEYPQARQYYEQALATAQELGDRSGVASSLHQLGMLHQQQGEYPQARQHYEQSLRIRQELGDRPGVAQVLAQMGVLADQEGQPALAAGRLLQALTIFEQLGMPQRKQARRDLLRMKRKMGNAAFDEAVAAVQGDSALPELLEDEQGISLDELVGAVVNNTIAVMTSMPEKKGEWWNALGQMQADAVQQNQNDLAVFLDLVRQLLEGRSPEGLTARVPQDFLAAWEAILAGISKG